MKVIKKSVVIVTFIFFVLLIIGASFAYFGAFTNNVSNKVAINTITEEAKNSIFYSENANVLLEVLPNQMIQGTNNTFKIANNTTADINVTLISENGATVLTTCTYDVYFKYTGDTFYGAGSASQVVDNEFTYVVEGSSGVTPVKTGEQDFDDFVSSKTTPVKVASGSISAMSETVTQNIKVDVNFYNMPNVNQSSLASKNFAGQFYVDNVDCGSFVPGYLTILNNNGGISNIESKPAPDLTTIAYNDEGMYATLDNLGMSYYFRGSLNDNWVKFGQENGSDIWWRIIRINGDGSIRMIYTGTTAPTESTQYSMTGDGAKISVNNVNTFAYNNASSNTSFTYMGFQYTLDDEHGYGKCTIAGTETCTVNGKTIYNSNAKQVLEKWWDTTNLGTLFLNGEIGDTIFCNDRINNGTNRMEMASFICQNLGDRFTVETNNGNGALLYPVGLITLDEIKTAGLIKFASARTYLAIGNQSFWTMTAAHIYSNSRNYYCCNFGHSPVTSAMGLRPVISLASNVKLTGSGLYNDPYIVQE